MNLKKKYCLTASQQWHRFIPAFMVEDYIT